MSANYENTITTVTADLTKKYDVEKKTSLAEKKSRLFENTTSKVALTMANWILRILIEATGIVRLNI